MWVVDGGLDGVYVWDIESSPTERQDIGFHQCYAYRNISVDPPYVYVAAQEWGLIILRFDDPTGIEEDVPFLPVSTEILSAYPNPFNSTVTFNIISGIKPDGNLKIYDIAGRLVREIELISRDQRRVSVQWDGKNNYEEDVSSGIYFAKYGNGEKQETLKVVLLR